MRLARIISRLCGPLIVAGALLIVGTLHAGLGRAESLGFLLTMAHTLIGPVVILRLWLLKVHLIDWDIADRKKRIVPLGALLVILVINLWVVGQWGNLILTSMFMVFFFWLVGFFLITLFWKISGHTGIATLATTVSVLWFGWAWWPIFLIVPLVGWARVKTQAHTVGQVVAGTVYSIVVLQLLR